MQSSSQIITTNKQSSSLLVSTGWMSFLSPNQQCQNTEETSITLPQTCSTKLTWGLPSPTLHLTTKGSWLHWGRVSKPLVSPDTSNHAGDKRKIQDVSRCLVLKSWTPHDKCTQVVFSQ